MHIQVGITDIPAAVAACLMFDNQNASHHLTFGPLSKDSWKTEKNTYEVYKRSQIAKSYLAKADAWSYKRYKIKLFGSEAYFSEYESQRMSPPVQRAKICRCLMSLRPRSRCAGWIWKRRYHGPENASNVFRLHYTTEEFKTQQSLVIQICVWGKLGQGNHVIITFSKGFLFKRQRKAGVFKFLRFEECRWKALFSWRINVHGRPNHRNKAAFSTLFDIAWTESLICNLHVQSTWVCLRY